MDSEFWATVFQAVLIPTIAAFGGLIWHLSSSLRVMAVELRAFREHANYRLDKHETDIKNHRRRLGEHDVEIGILKKASEKWVIEAGNS